MLPGWPELKSRLCDDNFSLLDDEGLDIKINKRGAAPLGGGQVLLRCPIKRQLKPLQLVDQGKIKRIRGTAWAVRVSPSVPNRVVEAAKGVLLKFLPDIYIHTDHFTGPKSGKSPGFGLTLYAETTTGKRQQNVQYRTYFSV
jgi:RNA 3'-terminal phosphate cyclase-like protein